MKTKYKCEECDCECELNFIDAMDVGFEAVYCPLFHKDEYEYHETKPNWKEVK